MITSRMNASEIAKIRIKDNERIKAFQVTQGVLQGLAVDFL